MVRSMVTKYLVIKDIIHTIEDFKQEMFLSWAIDRNHIKHDLLLSLTNFVVNCFSFQKSEFFSFSLSWLLLHVQSFNHQGI